MKGIVGLSLLALSIAAFFMGITYFRSLRRVAFLLERDHPDVWANLNQGLIVRRTKSKTAYMALKKLSNGSVDGQPLSAEALQEIGRAKRWLNAYVALLFVLLGVFLSASLLLKK